MSLIHNERRKITATAINGIAIATMVAGAVAPLIAWSYGVSNAPSGRYLIVTSAIWFLAAICLHLIARAMLGGLKE